MGNRLTFDEMMARLQHRKVFVCRACGEEIEVLSSEPVTKETAAGYLTEHL